MRRFRLHKHTLPDVPPALGVLAAAAAPWSIFGFQLLAILFLLSSLFLPRVRQGLLRPSTTGWLVAAFIGMLTITVVHSASPQGALDVFRRSWHISLFFVPLFLSDPRLTARRITTAIAFSGGACSMLLLLSFLFGAHHPVSPFSGVTTASILALMSAAAALIGWHEATSPLERRLNGAAVLLSSAAVLVLQLRLPIVLLVAGTLCFGIAWRKSLVLFFSVATLAAALCFGTMLPRVVLMLSGYEESRFILWNAAIGCLRDVPLLGYGPDSFHALISASVLSRLDDVRVGGWHNDILTVAIEFGPLAGILVVLIFGALFRTISRLLRKTNGQSALRALFLFFTILMIASMANSVIDDPVTGALAWLTGGFVDAINRFDGRGKERSEHA